MKEKMSNLQCGKNRFDYYKAQTLGPQIKTNAHFCLDVTYDFLAFNQRTVASKEVKGKSGLFLITVSHYSTGCYFEGHMWRSSYCIFRLFLPQIVQITLHYIVHLLDKNINMCAI